MTKPNLNNLLNQATLSDDELLYVIGRLDFLVKNTCDLGPEFSLFVWKLRLLLEEYNTCLRFRNRDK